MDMEFNPISAAIAILASLLLLVYIWRSAAWDSFGLSGRIMATVLLPPMIYFGVNF